MRPRVLLDTVRTWSDGLRFAYTLGIPDAPPPVAPTEEVDPLTRYFDSVTEGPGIWKWRHYFPIYHRHLQKFVGREVHVVEIGVFSGGSLPMWRHYFGDRCQVYGIDIEPACVKHERDGVSIFIGDQADPAFWRSVLSEVPRVDVVIDDGGHEPHQQIPTLRALLPHMAFGGVYVCEDIHGALHQFNSFIDGLTRPFTGIFGKTGSDAKAVHQHVASIHRYPALTVIEKPDRPVLKFPSEKHGTLWQPGIYDH